MVSQNQRNFDNIDDELVVKVSQELECFKQTFFRLIGKAQKILKQLETQKKMLADERSEVKIFQKEYDVLSDFKNLQRTCQSLRCRFGAIWVAESIIGQKQSRNIQQIIYCNFCQTPGNWQ
jgi:hypothetical protein